MIRSTDAKIPVNSLCLKTPHGCIMLYMKSAEPLPAWLREHARRLLRTATMSRRLQTWPTGTHFQLACWKAAMQIPCGQTRTYAWLAARAGSPLALRAAAQAMRKNPWPLVIPCHRVVGARDIGGYGGSREPSDRRVTLKRWLLAREGCAQYIDGRSQRRSGNDRMEIA